MNNKIFIILFFLFALISVSAVSAADADGNNDTIVSSANAEILSAANDVNAIDDLNKDYSDSDDKALANDAKSLAFGKNNEIIGATYEEANGDSASPVLGAGEYDVNIECWTASYDEFRTEFEAHIQGPDQPVGRLQLDVDGKQVASVDIDRPGQLFSCDPVNAGTHTWSANFQPNGGGDTSSGSGSFTINKADSSINIINPSIEIDVGASANLNLYVDMYPYSASPSFSSSDDNVAKVENGQITGVGVGTATITVSFAGNTNYNAAENKTITVTVNEDKIRANWTYISMAGKEVSITGVIPVPWNYYPECYVKYANGTALPVGTKITISCQGEQNYTINAVTQEDGLFNVNLSNVKLGEYKTTFSAENYTDAKATVYVVKALTEINVTDTNVSLKVNKNVPASATLTPADAGNLTYTSSNSSIAIVENGKIKGIKEGKANITVSFAENEMYFAAKNKTIEVTVTLNDASVAAEDITLDIGANATIAATTTPEGLKVDYTPDNSGVVTVEDGVVTGVKVGTAKVTLTVGGDEVYAENSTTITVTVKKIDTTILAEESLELTIGSNDTVLVVIEPISANLNATFASSNPSIVTVDDDGNVKAVGVGNATITVSYAGDDKYNAAENKTITVTVNEDKIRANWTYISMAGKEVSITGVIPVPWNYYPECYVKYANGTALPVGTKITISCQGEQNYTINAVTQEDGLFNVNLSNVKLGAYQTTFSAENYTDAKATVYVVKALTEINVTNTNVSLKVNENVPASATLTPADAGNLTYTSSNSSIAIVENGKIKGIKEGKANITVSFAENEMYFAAKNKTIEVTVTLNDASVAAEDITLDIGANVTIAATTTPEGLEVDYTPDNSGVVTVEDGVVTGVKVGTAKVTLTVGGDGVYAENSTTITVTVKKIDTNITVDEESLDLRVGDDSSVTATLTPADAGNVTFTSSNPSVVTVDKNGNVKAVGVGNATITVSYAGDDKYNAAENVTVAVTVKDPKQNTTMDIVTGEVVEDENSTITVNLPEDATGNVTAVVEGEEYTAPVVNGTANISVPGLRPGNYSVPVTYSGDDKYNPATEKITYNVEEVDKSDIISAPDVTKYFNGPERFVVNITDYKGNPVANRSVSIVINGKEYNKTTDTNGTASIALGLNSGVYNATVTVGNETLNPVVTVLSTVNGTDVVKVYRNDTQYYATFRDSEGNYLKDGTAVRFNINGVMYDRKISGSEGLAKLNINLNQGNYVITATNLETGENAANNITIISRLVENSDITKYYRNATQYTVKVIGDDGNPVGAGETVTFNINGVFYNRTTNASGIAKLNINLPPGDYIITAEYKNCKVSNNIKVLPVLSAKDLNKKYGTPDQFVATLLDGQGKALAGETVQFNVNGVLYNRVTDSDGHAKLNIRLMAGQYIITSSYNGASIANNIVITA
ncbi:Ig-like domain-containing protein [Methanobrevibacter millerae]|nr:Ig-like domain repeat protein [Methanobrevibacter millerae]